MRQEEAHGSPTVAQPRCEIAKTISEEECERPGEIHYRGLLLLCAPHAALLGLENRVEALLGSVSRMDEWMEENGSSAEDDEFVGRILREREEAVAALRLTREQIRGARKALD